MILPALQNFLFFFGVPHLIRWKPLDFQPNTRFYFFFIQLHLSPRPRSLSPFELPGRVDDTPEDEHPLELGSAKTWVGNQKPGGDITKTRIKPLDSVKGRKNQPLNLFHQFFGKLIKPIGCWQKSSAFFQIIFLAKSKGFTSPIIFHRLPVEKELWKIISIPKKNMQDCNRNLFITVAQTPMIWRWEQCHL